MGITELQLIIKALIIFCTVASFAITFNLNKKINNGLNAFKESRKPTEDKEISIIILPSKLHDRVIEELQKPSRKYFNYDRMDAFLKKNGAGYLSNYFINPVNFVFIKCLIAIGFFFFALICEFGFFISLVIGVGGFFVLDLIIVWKNRSDNKNMLDDIERANETIKMYGSISGTLYSAIHECYKFTENKRLKRGFFELYAELQMTHSYELAIKHFLEKFNNDFLHTLGRNIEQAGTSGFNELLLDDMTKDMEELQREKNYNYKSSLKTKWALLLMMIFISALLLCIYGMAGDLTIGIFE